MKLLEKEKNEVAVSRPLAAPRPTVKPTIRVNARVVSCPAPRRRQRDSGFVGRLMMFGSLLGLTYVSSTLGGYVMLERARQQGRHGEERAAYARQEATAARESIDALTNPSVLRSWADTHGFVTDGPKPAGDARVVLR